MGSHFPGGPWGRRGGADNRPLPHIAHRVGPLRGWAGGVAAGPESSVPASPMPPCPALPWGGPGLAAADTMVGVPRAQPHSEPVGLLPPGCDTARVWGRGRWAAVRRVSPERARPRDSEHVSVTCPGRNLRPRSSESDGGLPVAQGLPSQQLACSPTLWPGQACLLCAACGHLASPGSRPWAQLLDCWMPGLRPTCPGKAFLP